jgi:CRP-like cAMP-binding protein
MSVISIFDNGRTIEAGVAGREGMVGVPVVLGVEASPTECFVQSPGTGWRMDAALFRSALEQSRSLHAHFLRYVMAFLGQITQTAACNGVHTLQERLARWLLMSHDRCDGDRLKLTQEVIATMLGVRRASVTEAAGGLQKAGVIACAKGTITILDRAALEQASCECYGIVRQQFGQLFP